jgi:two-component system chemotaxis response regulator CheY
MAKILIVDDSAFARDRIRRLLEDGGHDVVGSSGASSEALDLYRELGPDLVTLDHVMDDKPGEEVLQSILEFDPQARVIMISGSNDAELEKRVLKAGALAFVEKFSTHRNLLQVVDKVMAEQR